MPLAPFSKTLEKCALHALLTGTLPRDLLKPEELSKQGRQILSAVDKLSVDSKPPYQPDSVYVLATQLFGGEKSLCLYLQQIVATGAGAETGDIVKAVRDRDTLVKLVNEASSQLGKGTLDITALTAVLQATTAHNKLVTVESLLADGIPAMPTGVPVRSLPAVTIASGGVFGVWAIGGEPGLGKSTLAWQITLEVAREIPCLYFDFETGAETLLHRTGELCRGNLDAARRATRRVYIRDHIRTLDADLSAIPAPALVIIDSLQKLPTSVLHRRTSLDQWVHKLEALTKRGYSVLLVSEKSRASYGQSGIGGFKESGEIEYTATFGAYILASGDDDTIKFFVVKNRHRPHTGNITTLVRNPDRPWWFTEESFQASRD